MEIIITVLIGLMIGSFLNVVMVRYPILLEAQWRRDCQQQLNLPVEPKSKLNLFTPRSHCQQCKRTIKIHHNIPVISYFFLRGHCAYCKAKISPLYPTIEILSAILSVFVVIRYQITWQMPAALIMTWVLILLFFIDLKKQILPDNITLTTLWLGLFLSLFYLFVSPPQAILGAILGYGLLWTPAWFYQLIRRKPGMGHGDFKMLSMIGAWFGTKIVLNTFLIAVFGGLIISVVLLLMEKISINRPIPFGPFIAMAGWVSVLSGPILLQWLLTYLS